MNLLPKAVFDQHIIGLGKTGAGKSSVFRLIIENLLDAGHRCVIVTPKADWWGLKLSADGKHPGYAIPVFGADHADMPLNAQSGKIMAELLATGDRSAILQLRDFRSGETTRFWIDFASTLFRLMRGKMFLFIDEVHNFAPKGKVLSNDVGEMIHWSNKLASEARGLGITLLAASQRASKVHNDFLTSCETLIAMRVTTSWDREAVKDWVEGCGDDVHGKEVLRTLAQMKRGDAWVWSPEAEFGPKQLHFPLFKTFDSFKPQTIEATKLRGWASVDLDEVKKKLEVVVKEAEGRDPAKLQARIRELESELRKKVGPPAPAPKGPQLAELRSALDAMTKYAGRCEDFIAEQATAMVHVCKELDKTRKYLWDMSQKNPPDVRGKKAQAMVEKHTPAGATFANPKPYTPQHPAVARPASPKTVESIINNGALTGPQKRILGALAQLRSIGRDNPSREMVAAWAKYNPGGGAFRNPLGALNSFGYIVYPSDGTVRMTELAIETVGEQDPPSQEEINRRIEQICPGPERKIFASLVNMGRTVTREELAAESGYDPNGGAFRNPLGALRTKGIIEYPEKGTVKLSDWVTI